MKKFKNRQILTFISVVAVVAVAVLVVVRVQGADSCASVEKYDIVHGQCYIECDTDQQCAKLDKQADAELSQSYGESKTKPASSKPAPEQTVAGDSLYTTESTGSETNGTVYTVAADGLVPKPTAAHARIWQAVTKLLGTQAVKDHILSFEVFDDANNDTAASVWRSDNPAKWHMSLNQAFATTDKKDLIRTIVHEYGHIVTLSGDQVSDVQGVCPRLTLSEGCGKDGSYINTFYNNFWKQYGIDADKAGDLSEQQAADLYADQEHSFVSEYASTNITEDIAESFADFVVKSKPTGTVVSDQKVRFFYNYPELVARRQQIRAAMSLVSF